MWKGEDKVIEGKSGAIWVDQNIQQNKIFPKHAMILSQITSVGPVLDFFLAIFSCIRYEGQSKQVASQEQDRYAKGRAEDSTTNGMRQHHRKGKREGTDTVGIRCDTR